MRSPLENNHGAISTRIAGTALTPCPPRVLPRNRFAVFRARKWNDRTDAFFFNREKSYETVTTRSILYGRGNARRASKSNDIALFRRALAKRVRNGRNDEKGNASLEGGGGGCWRGEGDSCVIRELVLYVGRKYACMYVQVCVK